MNRQLVGHLFATLVSIVWGTTFISTKLLLDVYDPFSIIVLRFTLAWIVLFLLSPKPLIPKSWKSELPFFAAGLSGLTLYFVFENSALDCSLASTVGIIIAAAPMFTALLMWICKRASRPNGYFFVGFLLALAGITLISVVQGEEIAFPLLGTLLTLGAALSWACYGLSMDCIKEGEYSHLQATRKIFFWGLVCTTPLLIPFGSTIDFSQLVQPVYWGNLVYLGVGASAICFVLWNKALVLIGPIATSTYIYFMPVVTLVASALILSEPITLGSLGAVALIMLGLWLSQKKSPAPATSTTERSL